MASTVRHDRHLLLTVFTRVAEEGSFVGAARALGLSPASVSSHVRALETRLRTRLFDRTTRSVSLTPQGDTYYRHVREILDSVNAADHMFTPHRQAPVGTLRVAAPALLGSLILIPGLPALLRAWPDLRVELTLTAEHQDILGGKLDVCLQWTMAPEPGLVYRPLGLCPVRTVASPSYLRRRGVPKTPDDLHKHDLIGVRAVPGAVLSTWRFQQAGRMVSRDYPCRFTADSGEAQIVAALAGGGIFQAMHYAVADLIGEGKLVPVLGAYDWSGPPLGAVHLPNRYLLPKVAVFLDFVKRQISGKIDPYRDDWDNR
jgi:DNA-binding transcriptional LysR family regulator